MSYETAPHINQTKYLKINYKLNNSNNLALVFAVTWLRIIIVMKIILKM